MSKETDGVKMCEYFVISHNWGFSPLSSLPSLSNHVLFSPSKIIIITSLSFLVVVVFVPDVAAFGVVVSVHCSSRSILDSLMA